MIYLDNAATTRISDLAFASMIPYLKENYGNPSSIYKLGRSNHQAIENARKQIASLLKVSPAEIYFTSCGSEADNWALQGIMRAYKKQSKNHLIISKIEHHAVLHTAQALEKEGFLVTYLDVDEEGRVNLQQLKQSINDKTALVSIMYANNEVGTIQPVCEIGRICHENHVLYHCDAVQAVGSIPLDISNIDLLSASAHKFNGPKGVGFLYINKKVKINNFIEGGGQEKGKRPGTENVAGIIGMATALQENYELMEEKNKRIEYVRNQLQEALLKIPGSHFNGDEDHRLPGILNISFEHIDGQSLLFELDLKGICASSGSACSSGSVEASHVLLAMGVPYVLAQGALRLSVGRYNDISEVDTTITAINDAIEYLRK